MEPKHIVSIVMSVGNCW